MKIKFVYKQEYLNNKRKQLLAENRSTANIDTLSKQIFTGDLDLNGLCDSEQLGKIAFSTTVFQIIK